jgi:tetratricopeptide (TPR) repeat protein
MIAAELADERLDALVGDEPDTDVATVFSWSYRGLTPPAAHLFRRLSAAPGPDVAGAAAASLAGEPAALTHGLLLELNRANLLGRVGPDRYRLHDLLHVYAAVEAERTDPDPERQATVRRVLDHYLAGACTAAQLMYPHLDPVERPDPIPGVAGVDLADASAATAWLAAERVNLVAAIGHAARSGLDHHTCSLALALGNFLDRGGYRVELLSTLEDALAAAYRLARPAFIARLHRSIGLAFIGTGQIDQAAAHLDQALARYRDLDDALNQAHTHRVLANLNGQREDWAAAMAHCVQSHDFYRVAGNELGVANQLNAIGWTYAQLGQFVDARTYCLDGLAELQGLGDRAGVAATWHSLGYIHHHLGDLAEAVDAYRHACTVYQDAGSRVQEAMVRVDLGDTLLDRGDPAGAGEAWQLALAAYTAVDHPAAGSVRAKLEGLAAGRAQ